MMSRELMAAIIILPREARLCYISSAKTRDERSARVRGQRLDRGMRVYRARTQGMSAVGHNARKVSAVGHNAHPPRLPRVLCAVRNHSVTGAIPSGTSQKPP